MSHALLAIQNILQNLNIFYRSRETVLFMRFGDKKVTQFSSFPLTSVSYRKEVSDLRTHQKCMVPLAKYFPVCPSPLVKDIKENI